MANVGRAWLAHHKTYLLVTGSSRGLGRTLSLRFAPFLGPDSVILLLARDVDKLESSKAEILQAAPKVKVVTQGYDLSQPDPVKFREIIASSLSKTGAKAQNFEQAIVVHNAASMTPIKLAEDCEDPAEWESYMRFNLYSPVCINSVFLKTFPKDAVPHRLVINITALASRIPILSAPFYNTGKAARDQFFLTLAKEDPDTAVLTYSPGPLKTDMMSDAQPKLIHPVAKAMMKQMAEKGQLLSCDQTVGKLLDIIKENSFESGIRADYYGRSLN